MATLLTTIYRGNLATNSENLSSEFDRGFGFYLASSASEQKKVEVFLQVQVSNTERRQVRLDNFNISSTQQLTIIPSQIAELGLPMRLSIVPSEEFNLEIVLLQHECSLCGIKSQIEQLETKLDNRFAVIDSRFANIDRTLAIAQTTLNQILTAVSVDLVVPGLSNDDALFLIS